MGLVDDNAEKLQMAGEWLLHDVANVTRFHRNAAWEYVLWIYRHTPRNDLREQARDIINKYREHAG